MVGLELGFVVLRLYNTGNFMATDIYSIHFDGGAVVVSKGKLTHDPRFTLLGKPEVGYHHLRMVHSQFGRNTIPTLPANLGMNPSILPY